MNRRRLTAVGVGVAGAIAVTLLTNPYLPAQALSPWVRESFEFQVAYADPDPKTLVVQYGDGGCPSEAVRHDVVQQPDRVTVTLTRQHKAGGRSCTASVTITPIRIALTAPLGTRTVIDGSRQKAMPVGPSQANPFSR